MHRSVSCTATPTMTRHAQPCVQQPCVRPQNFPAHPQHTHSSAVAALSPNHDLTCTALCPSHHVPLAPAGWLSWHPDRGPGSPEVLWPREGQEGRVQGRGCGKDQGSRRRTVRAQRPPAGCAPSRRIVQARSGLWPGLWHRLLVSLGGTDRARPTDWILVPCVVSEGHGSSGTRHWVVGSMIPMAGGVHLFPYARDQP